jgi:hypothetical protein
MLFRPAFRHFPILGPEIVLNTLLTNNLFSLLDVSDQVPHPYKSIGKIIVLYTYSLSF